jgi:hypothetical protein
VDDEDIANSSTSSSSSDDECVTLPIEEETISDEEIPTWKLIFRASYRLLSVDQYRNLLIGK